MHANLLLGYNSRSHLRLGAREMSERANQIGRIPDQHPEPKPVKVSWYCRPKPPALAALRAAGFPVEDFAPDTTLRVGKCWGRYLGQPELLVDELDDGR